MACYGGWKLDIEVDDIIVPLCARYSGHGTNVLRECNWCVWNSEIFKAAYAYAKAITEENK